MTPIAGCDCAGVRPPLTTLPVVDEPRGRRVTVPAAGKAVGAAGARGAATPGRATATAAANRPAIARIDERHRSAVGVDFAAAGNSITHLAAGGAGAGIVRAR